MAMASETLSVYLNTYLPYKNSLFLTNKIESSAFADEKLISDATQELELDRNVAKKVWMYFIKKDGTLTKTIYQPKGIVAKLLNVQDGTITNDIDKWIVGIKGNYLFSRKLDSLELEKLMEISSLRKFNHCKI